MVGSSAGEGAAGGSGWVQQQNTQRVPVTPKMGNVAPIFRISLRTKEGGRWGGERAGEGRAGESRAQVCEG